MEPLSVPGGASEDLRAHCKQSRTEMVKALAEAAHGTEDQGWTFKKMKQNVEIWVKDIPNNPLKFWKGRGVVKASAQYVFDYIRDVDNVLEYDKMAIEAYHYERWDDAHAFQYNSYNSGFPMVSNRDFTMYASEVWLKSGDFAIVTNSIDHPARPPVNGLVRAVVQNSGLYIEENGNGDDECIVTYVVQLDPRGMIPSFVVNITAVNQPLVVAQIRNAIEARAKAGENVHAPRSPVPPTAVLEPADPPAPSATEAVAAKGKGPASYSDYGYGSDSDLYSYSYSYDPDDDPDARKARKALSKARARGVDLADLQAPPSKAELDLVRALEAKVADTRARVTDAEARVNDLEAQLSDVRARAAEQRNSKRSCCAIS